MPRGTVCGVPLLVPLVFPLVFACSSPASQDPPEETVSPDTDDGSDTASPTGDQDGCLTEDDGSSTGPGRYAVESFELAAGIDGATVYYPAELPQSDCTFAVVSWGNGTSSSGGDAYPVYHQRLAGHGFVVAVAHTNFAANGPVILETAAAVLALNDDPESAFHQKLRPGFGVIGKSQGAIAAARDVDLDPDAIAAVMIAGSTGSGDPVERPALFATGDQDFLRTNTRTGFEAALDTAVYAEASGGVDHLMLDDHVGIAQLATSFLRCHVQDDPQACAFVACADCQSEPWAAYETR